MKKILYIGAAMGALVTAPAYASGLNIGIDLGYAQPTYVAEPEYVEPAYVETPVAEPVYYGHRHYYHPQARHDIHRGDDHGHGHHR